jgi:hypothetical protein
MDFLGVQTSFYDTNMLPKVVFDKREFVKLKLVITKTKH